MDSTERLLIEILAAAEDGGDIEELLSRHPKHEQALRRRLGRLGQIGVAPVGDGRHPEIPGFQIECLLGRGGMAEVWLATRERDHLKVALKVLRSSSSSPNLMTRFQREAQALAQLDHPGIVGIHEAGQVKGQSFIAMEFIDGESLDQRIARQEGLDLPVVVTWARDMARALSAAHAVGIVHRDLKPSNVLVTADERVVLIDFGLTRELTATTLSVTGSFIGSPHYAAPEQIRGDHDLVGPATDVYAVGATLYELLAGRPPFEGSRAEELFHRILTAEPTPLAQLESRVSPPLSLVVSKAMEKRVIDRYQSATALAEDLDAVLELRQVQARPPSLWRRGQRQLRQRPVLASFVAMLCVAVLAVLSLQVLAQQQRLRDRRQQAETEFARAREVLDQYLMDSEDLPERILQFQWREQEIYREVHNEEEVSAFNREQRALEQAQTASEKVFTEIMEILKRVQDLDGELVGPERLRAQLYLARWRVARANRNRVMTDFLAERVRAHDKEGDLAAAVRPNRRVNLVTNPPGARVDAFVYQRHDELVPGGQPRLVAVPIRKSEANQLGRWALRVRWAEAELSPEDLILAVDGQQIAADDQSMTQVIEQLKHQSETARSLLVWRNGEELTVTTSAAVVARMTASPLWHGAASFVGETPLVDAEIAGDEMLLLVRAEGFEPERVPLAGLERPFTITLTPQQRLPQPFVPAHSHNGQSMIVMDREVTSAEFLDFLNQSVQDTAVFRPLKPQPWPINESGQVSLPAGLAPNTPAHGISVAAAEAYADWRTQAARTAGASWSFQLPDWRNWQVFVRSDGGSRRFPWGSDFRPRYAKSCFAEAIPCLEPVLSYPIDETTTGLYDTVGSVSEICRGWFWEERQQHPACGGSWQHAEPGRFEMTYAWGLEAGRAPGHVGFRLQLVHDDD